MKRTNREKTAVLSKDSFTICGKTLIPPFTIEQVTNTLGTARLYEEDVNNKDEHKGKEESHTTRIYIWDELGLQGWLNESQTEVSTFGLYLAPHRRNLPKSVFDGVFKIGNKEYREAKWKRKVYGHECKLGNFIVSTLLPSDVDEYKWYGEELMEEMMCRVEITWELPKVKTIKYKLKQPEEATLVFKNFNFKLAIIEVLMYEKELLEPKFDVYEFAKEYSRRKIDVEAEGYEPIGEVVKWFKDLPIPARFASEVTEIDMDGGDEVYLQIFPFWDGEDERFNLDKISPEEIQQFPRLKKVTLMTGKFEKIAKIFEAAGIETSLL